MESKFIPTLQAGNGYTYLKLKGILDEDNLLNNLLSQIQGRLLLIDMAEMERINSCGVRDWVNWLNQIQALGIAVILLRCSPVIVSQANMVANFAADAFIHSFYAPYVHPDTGEEQNVLLFTEEIRQNTPIKAPKIFNESGDELEFDEFEESFFAFINDKRQMSYQIPADIQAVIEYFLPEAKTRQPVVQNKLAAQQPAPQQTYQTPKMNAGPAYANAYAQQNMGGYGQANPYGQPNPYASQQQSAVNPYAQSGSNPYAQPVNPYGPSPSNPYAKPVSANPYAQQNPGMNGTPGVVRPGVNAASSFSSNAGSGARPIPQPQQPLRHDQPPLPGMSNVQPAPAPAGKQPAPAPSPAPAPAPQAQPASRNDMNGQNAASPAFSEPNPAPEPVSPLAAQASSQIRLPQRNQQTIQAADAWIPPAADTPDVKKRRIIIWVLLAGILIIIILLIVAVAVKK